MEDGKSGKKINKWFQGIAVTRPARKKKMHPDDKEDRKKNELRALCLVPENIPTQQEIDP